MKAKQRTCKSKYMKRKVMNELCEKLTNSFQPTPSRPDKTPQAPSSKIATPQHANSDGLTHTDRIDIVAGNTLRGAWGARKSCPLISLGSKYLKNYST